MEDKQQTVTQLRILELISDGFGTRTWRLNSSRLTRRLGFGFGVGVWIDISNINASRSFPTVDASFNLVRSAFQ
jgi:hypothetical protein